MAKLSENKKLKFKSNYINPEKDHFKVLTKDIEELE